ncbi:MAG: MBL fold metallo-hydrolase [Chloroflexota bacterium]
MKRWQIIVLILVAPVIVLSGYLFLQIRSLEVEKLSDDLFVLRGLGGNTAVLRTDEGAIVVDTMTTSLQGRRIRNMAKSLTGVDPMIVINTHYHSDHTHGNPAFAPGTRVLSTERTLSHLHIIDGDFWSGNRAALLPTEIITDHQTLSIGGKTLELIHPGPGHTDGDLVILFADEGVIHMGDLLFNAHYPNIDLEAGGSVQKWPDTLDKVLELPFEQAIPGHGLTTDRAGIEQFQAFMNQLAQIAINAAESQLSLEETVATDRLTKDAGYEPIRFIVPIGLDREFVLTRAWEEVTGNYTRKN